VAADHYDMHYSVSGVDLEDAGYEVQADTDWAPPVSLAGSTVDLAGRPGTVPVGLPVPAAVPLQLVIRRRADGQAALEAYRRELVGLLSDPFATIRRSSGGQVTEAPFRLESMPPGDFLAGTWATFQPVLTLWGGLFRSLVAKDYAAPVGTTSLPIRGTAPVYDAVVRFAGPLHGAATVTDTRTGTAISWSGDLYQGQYVFVNAATMRAHIGSVDSWGGGTDASAGVDYPPAGRLTLWGRNGAPLGSVTVSDGDRALPGQQLVQDPDTKIFYKTEAAAGRGPLPSTRTVKVAVTGAPATLRVKEAWL